MAIIDLIQKVSAGAGERGLKLKLIILNSS